MDGGSLARYVHITVAHNYPSWGKDIKTEIELVNRGGGNFKLSIRGQFELYLIQTSDRVMAIWTERGKRF